MQKNRWQHFDRAEPAETLDRTLIDGVLYALDLVDSPPEEAFDKYPRLVTRHLGVPVALVSFVQEDRDRQYFKSQIGLAPDWADRGETPLSHSFCQFVKRDNRPLIVEDAPRDIRVCNNLAIADLGVRAYLGVPVHGPGGAPLGALCAIDTGSRVWSQDDLDAMLDLGACVTDQISLRAALKLDRGDGFPGAQCISNLSDFPPMR